MPVAGIWPSSVDSKFDELKSEELWEYLKKTIRFPKQLKGETELRSLKGNS